jgi:uncharacterized protein Veg
VNKRANEWQGQRVDVTKRIKHRGRKKQRSKKVVMMLMISSLYVLEQTYK